jgi:predicted outer membrane repeat protein
LLDLFSLIRGVNIFYKTSLNKRKILIIVLIFLIAILAISTISVVSAANITINSTSPGGLKKAIDTANNGDTILLQNGVYNGKNNTNIVITKSINIEGLGSKVVLDAQGKNRIFTVSGKNVSLKNLKLIKGYSSNKGGAIYHKTGDLTIIKCTFTNNKAFEGGAIYSEKNKLAVINSNFIKNRAEIYGGAIYSQKVKMTVSESSFTNNIAVKESAGAIYNKHDATIIKCTLNNNQAKNYGGAIVTYAKLTIRESTFINNKAQKDGGAIITSAKLSVISSNFTNNRVKRNGGAICGENGKTSSVNVLNSKFTKNIAGKVYNAIHTYQKSKLTKRNVLITPKDRTRVK